MDKDATRLEKLKTLESLLSESLMGEAGARDLASLARQYRETLREIDELEGAEVDDDEITALLSNRKSGGKPGAVR